MIGLAKEANRSFCINIALQERPGYSFFSLAAHYKNTPVDKLNYITFQPGIILFSR